MISYLLMFIVLISFSIFIHIKWNIKIEKSLPYTFIGIVLILYLFGLIKILNIGFYVVIVLAIISYVLSIIHFIKSKNKKEILKKIFSPGFVIWSCLFVFLTFYHYGRLLTGWDEFTHWGDVVKVMYVINDFSTNPNSLSAFQSYLPGMSLFQYFCSKFFTTFNEGFLFTSYQIFTFSLFLPFISKIKWKNWYMILIVLFLMFTTNLVIFPSFYKSIYIDSFLGLMFGFILANIYLDKDKKSKVFCLKMGLSLSMLTLVKDLGIGFSLICIFCIFIYSIIKNKKNFNKNNFLKKIVEISKVSIILVVVVFIVYLLWKLNIKINGASENWTNPLDIEFIIKSLLGTEETYGTAVRNNYLNVIRSNSITNGCLHLTPISCLVFFAFLFYFVLNDDIKNKLTDDKSTFVVSIVGGIGYVILLLVLYLWKFSEYEAINLASWNRYLGTYYQMFIYMLCFVLLNNSLLKINKYNLIIFIIFIFMFVPFSTMKSYLYPGIEATQSSREVYTNSAKNLESKLGNSRKKIYFICQNSSGYDYWVWKFSSRNNILFVNSDYHTTSWSIGKPYYDGDIWTQDISREEWMNMLLEEYEYVYLFRVDNAFSNIYGSLFQNSNDIDDDTLFIIDKNEKMLKLVN